MTRKSPEQIGAERVLKLPTFDSGESVPKAATNWVEEGQEIQWEPICNDPNNRGNVEIVESDVQGLVELLTNSSDAYLIQHTDDVESREELLDELDDEDEVLMEFTGNNAGGKDSDYSVIVADEGCGVGRGEFEDAFLKDPSTGGVDKRKYKYLYGEFGQGSLASVGVSKVGCKFVASALKEEPKKWSWSVTRYNKDRMRYEYLTVDGSVPTFSGKLRVGDFGQMSFGTITKVFNVDSTQTPRDVTSNPFIRRLGHAFPETAVPLNITDNRKGQARRRVWSGMKDELISDPNVERYTSRQQLGRFGEVRFDAFVTEEGESFDNEFVNSQIRDRVFYTVYGMTHHSESYNKLKSKCDLNGINENTLLFIDCSNINKPINDIFMPSRTGMKKGEVSEAFKSHVRDSVSNWDELQGVDKNRASVSDIVETDGVSPIDSVEFVNENAPVPSFKSESGEVETELNISTSTDVDYCEWNCVDVDMIGFDGDWSASIEGGMVSLTVSVDSDSTGTVCIRDHEFGESFTKTFDVITELEEDDISLDPKTLGEAQADRANRGNSFEGDVIEKVVDEVDYEVTRESETPERVMDELQFDVSGTEVQPDTDIVIHNGVKPKGIISCKRSLRERVGQTAFWKMFLDDKEVGIPMYLATLDPDNELNEGRKWRAIAENVLDGVIVLGDTKEHFNQNVFSAEKLGKLTVK